MNAASKIKDGDFVVSRDRWQDRAVQVIKITPQLVFYRDATWGDRERRIRIQDVVFSGPQEIAERLVQQLTSSQALLDDESRKAHERKIARDARIIEAAHKALITRE